MGVAVASGQIRTVPSPHPEARADPSPLKASDMTPSQCPINSRSRVRVVGSQSRT